MSNIPPQNGDDRRPDETDGIPEQNAEPAAVSSESLVDDYSRVNGEAVPVHGGENQPRSADERPAHETVAPEIAEQAYTQQAEPGLITASEPTAPEPTAPEPTITAPTTAFEERHDYPPEATAEPDGWPLSYAPTAKPIYVQAPTPPVHKGNRGFGILVSVIATAVFALVYGGILALITTLERGSVDIVGGILIRAPFWLPVVIFFVAMVLLVSIVNRGGWWAYVLGGFIVAALTYGGYVGGALIEQAMLLTPSEVGSFVLSSLLTPPAVVAFVVAREVPVWFGAWIASRGRKVRERNDEAQREYERVLEQGPVV